MKNVTMITLSASEHIPAQIPENCEYINHVSVFQDQQDMVEQILLAVGKVETPYYFFSDDDDPVPLVVPTPTGNNGILYGDLIYTVGNKTIRRRRGAWDANEHLNNPFLIHRAVCRTDYTLYLASILPTPKVWFEFLYYYFLADCFGAEYNPDFQYVWSRKETGLHITMPPKMGSTGMWINANRERVRSLVKP